MTQIRITSLQGTANDIGSGFLEDSTRVLVSLTAEEAGSVASQLVVEGDAFVTVDDSAILWREDDVVVPVVNRGDEDEAGELIGAVPMGEWDQTIEGVTPPAFRPEPTPTEIAAADELMAAWEDLKAAYRKALRLIDDREGSSKSIDRFEAYVDQVFDSSRMLGNQSIGDWLTEVAAALDPSWRMDDAD